MELKRVVIVAEFNHEWNYRVSIELCYKWHKYSLAVYVISGD